jgi:PIN domain nuclease of toxin-antitoxin system
MDRFDIVHAYYLFNSHYHGGQASPEYARLSRILSYYRPASDRFENRNQIEIYERLIAEAGYKLGRSACVCCCASTIDSVLCADCYKADCAVNGCYACEAQS